MSEIPEDNVWPLGSYAPGRYSCRCRTCGVLFDGDKRALSCLECAVRQVKTERTRALSQFEAGKGKALGPLSAIVPPHCTGCSFVFEPGVLHVKKDGSGYIVVNEDDFALEDDRCEGPDGPEGSIHWIARMDASEIVALRDFLNGALASPSPAPEAEPVDIRRKAFDAGWDMHARLSPTPAVDADAVIEAAALALWNMDNPEIAFRKSKELNTEHYQYVRRSAEVALSAARAVDADAVIEAVWKLVVNHTHPMTYRDQLKASIAGTIRRALSLPPSADKGE